MTSDRSSQDREEGEHSADTGADSSAEGISTQESSNGSRADSERGTSSSVGEGDQEDRVIVREGGLSFYASPHSGQKTGFYAGGWIPYTIIMKQALEPHYLLAAAGLKVKL